MYILENQTLRGISTKHKVIFALIVITTVLLIIWAGYVNYSDVAVKRNVTIMADLVGGLGEYLFYKSN